MNLVISECEEFRRVKAKKGSKAQQEDGDDEEDEMKRMLGLVILRGETIVTLSVEGPPPAVDESKGPQVRSLFVSAFWLHSSRADPAITLRLALDQEWAAPQVAVWVFRVLLPCKLPLVSPGNARRPLELTPRPSPFSRRQAPQNFAPPPPGMPGMMYVVAQSSSREREGLTLPSSLSQASSRLCPSSRLHAPSSWVRIHPLCAPS